MNTIKIVRKELGLKQEYLAVLLGVKRSQISMAECAQRELPSAASQIVNQMFINLGISEISEDNIANYKLPTKPHKYLEMIGLEANTRANHCLEIAKQMELNYASAINRQLQLPELFPEPTAQQKLVLNLLEIESQAWLVNCNPTLQAKFRKIGALLNQIQSIVK